ncbi:MAG: thiol reductant ABC exporter subunit CydC [Actinomycetota bacterium]|nr:thiol reductant ABC exporter subunit CydC [Actinomycetota bacterium]
MSSDEPGDLSHVAANTLRREWARAALAVASGMLGQLSALGLLATSAWLIATSSLRPPILTLSVAIAAVRLFALLRGAGRYGERLASHDVALRGLARVRLWAYRHLERLVPGGLGDIGRGDVLARVVTDVDATQDLVVRIAVPSLTALATVAAAVALAGLVLPLAGAVLGAGLVSAGVVVPAGARWAGRRVARRRAEERGAQGAQLVDIIEGAADLIAFDATDTVLTNLRRGEASLARTTRRLAAVAGGANGLGALAAAATTAAMVALGADAVSTGRLGAVAVAVLGFVALASFDAIGSLPEAFSHLDDVLGAAQRVEMLAVRPAPVAEPTTVQTLSAPDGTDYVLSNIGVCYEPGRTPALCDVDLAITPGIRIAVVGSSGAGKSTLALALLRFVEVTTGRATLGGVDVANLAGDEVRDLIAWAPQDPHIFATTLAANLRLACPDAGDKALRDTLRAIGLGPWLDGLEHGLDTVLGERGLTVSGGERQRLGVARALLANRPILLLDEPTAHLDDASETLVRHHVLATSAGRALVWITHRLAGLEDFDQVVVLSDGRVVERGTAAELCGLGGTFATLLDERATSEAALSFGL